MQVDGGMIAALGEDIDEHGQGARVVERGVLRVHERGPGDRVPQDYGHHLSLDEPGHAVEELSLIHI